MIPLPVLEEITGRSGIAPRIELLLPIGARPRQLRVRTLLAGMLMALVALLLMPARLDPQNTKPVLGVLIGDPLDQPRQHLSIGWIRLRLHDRPKHIYPTG